MKIPKPNSRSQQQRENWPYSRTPNVRYIPSQNITSLCSLSSVQSSFIKNIRYIRLVVFVRKNNGGRGGKGTNHVDWTSFELSRKSCIIFILFSTKRTKDIIIMIKMIYYSRWTKASSAHWPLANQLILLNKTGRAFENSP